MNRFKFLKTPRPEFDPYKFLFKYENLLQESDDNYDTLDELFPKLRRIWIHRTSNIDFRTSPRNELVKKELEIELQISNDLRDPIKRKSYE